MRILTADDVRRVVPMELAVRAVAVAFAQLARGTAQVPLRTDVAQEQYASHSFFMPALLGESGELGMKVVSVFPHNASQGLPVIHALVVLIEAATGRPLAMLDGRYLTALRTGAASGVSAQYMARADAQVLAIIGAGAQAAHQVEAVCAVRPIERVLIVNRGTARAEILRATLVARGIGGDVRIATSARAALAEADIVCCATSSATPVFADADVRPGTHISGVGSFTPAMAEVPAATIGRARVAVDQHIAAWHEAGDLIAARAAGLIDETRTVELGAIIAGRVPGRSTADEITFFKSVGNAVQDVAVGHVALAEAMRMGIGVEVGL